MLLDERELVLQIDWILSECADVDPPLDASEIASHVLEEVKRELLPQVMECLERLTKRNHVRCVDPICDVRKRRYLLSPRAGAAPILRN